MKRKTSIKQKMVLMICGILLLSMALLGIISSILSETMLEKSIFSELNNINEGIIGTVSSYYKICINTLSNNINIVNSFIEGKTWLDEKKIITLNAVNQITGDKKNIHLPVMLIDNQNVIEDYKLIDKMTNMLGSAVTIFQIIPEGMIRISTSIVQADGKRAIGTYIPTDSPVYQSIIKGESYKGRAFVVNTWYMAEYKPIYDIKNNIIIGAIFCGIKPNSSTFKDEILKIKIGDTGYSYIIDTKGTLMLHPKLEGENLYETKDDKGNYFIKEICEKKNGIIYYPWKNPGEKKARLKVVLYKYFDGLDWIVASGSYLNEINKPLYELRSIMIIITVLATLISAVIIFFVILSLTDPIKLITLGAGRLSIGDIGLKGINFNEMNKIKKRNDELGDVGRAFSKMIDYQLEKVKIAEEIANGNLTVDVNVSSQEDKLGNALLQTLKSLNELMHNVKTSVVQVVNGANQVSQTSQILSQGATEQASSLEEITSSLTEINSQSKQNSDNANEANGIAKKAMESAKEGNNQIKELVSAMNKINSSADKIKNIIKLIDDIAFQTNLLALNANVEAARAGKYGKGFAVVAEEVSNLASRSAESVKETTEMIEEAIKNIQNGNGIVEITAKQLDAITDGANKVANLVEEIAMASKEQMQGLDQINQALGQIDQVTQSNTASAEESASAAEELASQADILESMIEKFKIKIHDEHLNKIFELKRIS